ncbi:MAG: hypothetical protein KC912_20915 [Proteobacteria bacterium]|nr:hypothetical protein [Pseudomonadota bacterium]
MQFEVQRNPSEDPWWWPLGPGAVVVLVVICLQLASGFWPLTDDGVRVVGGLLRAFAIAMSLLWVAAAIGLRVRHAQRTAPMVVTVDDEGVNVDGARIAWSAVSRVEWSPFGLLTEDAQGVRSHVAASVTDDEAAKLQAACDEAWNRYAMR